MKGAKRIIKAICNAELQNFDDKEFVERLDNYCIVDVNSGFFWGKMPYEKIKMMKSEAEKIST